MGKKRGLCRLCGPYVHCVILQQFHVEIDVKVQVAVGPQGAVLQDRPCVDDIIVIVNDSADTPRKTAAHVLLCPGMDAEWLEQG